MITRTAKLIVDLGNSETRVKTMYGKNAKGNPRSILTILDNRYSIVQEGKLNVYLNDESYDGKNSSLFKTDNGLYYCNGDLCNFEMKETSFRPSALEKKYATTVTKLTIINALKQGFIDVAKLSDTSLDELNVEWEVYLLLPPEDLESGAKTLAEMAKSIKNLDFLMPDIKKDVIINKVMIYPEGMCAFFGVIFERKGIVRNDYKYLIDPTESTVIFDIGAGTTDIVLVRGSQVVQSSRFTKEIGGNNVHRLVQRALRNKGISLPDDIVRAGTNTGYVKSGSRKIDISKAISDAKNAVSNQLVDAVQEFFESSMISIKTISNILVCGGGAEVPANPEIQPISNYIVGYMRRLSPDIKLVEPPMVRNKDNWERMSPRLMNITGAGILAE